LFPAVLLLGWFPPSSVSAAETSATGAKQEDPQDKAAWRELVDRQAAEYRIVAVRDRSHPLGPPKPVLRWANPTRITHFESCTYLWTFRGQPAVVACIFSTHQPGDPLQFCHALQSILREPIEVERDGRRVWYPASSKIEFARVPDAPPAEQSAVARLRQMKALATQFSATLIKWREDGSDREELRLLPQPIYRYESEDPEVLDGGVFAFVQGTDPEVLLLLEAVRRAGDAVWVYGFVRRTSGVLEARHRGKPVWAVPSSGNRTDPTQPEIYIDVRPQP
jgi:hypothetical protein